MGGGLGHWLRGGLAGLVLALGHTAPAAAQVQLVQVAAGSAHTCVIFDTDHVAGRVACWGYNVSGQIGDGTTTDRHTPTLVSGLRGVVQIALGQFNSCALRTNGRVYCWGRGAQGNDLRPVRVPGINNATQIAAGAHHNCAVLASGRVRCWGQNIFGQIGDGSTSEFRYPPVTVPGLRSVAELSLGWGHSCARMPYGFVRCWGANYYGQLGDDTTENRSSPAPVVGLHGVTGISVGTASSCALLETGHVGCWGYNLYGQLGDRTVTSRSRAVWVWGLTQVTGIALGADHSCALVANGRVRCWGFNYYGEIGDGTVLNNRLTTRQVRHLADAVESTAGWNHTCALTVGHLYCWGWNGLGQLGDGSATDHPIPVEIIVDPVH